MSSSQTKNVSRLLTLAQNSVGGRNWQMHAAGIYCGNKLICSSINNNRTKFGKNIYCCGHSEANCIWKYNNVAFKGKKNRSLLLGKLNANLKS